MLRRSACSSVMVLCVLTCSANSLVFLRNVSISREKTLPRLMACLAVMLVSPFKDRDFILLRLSACESVRVVNPFSARILPILLRLSACESERAVRPFNSSVEREPKNSACFSVIEVKPLTSIRLTLLIVN